MNMCPYTPAPRAENPCSSCVPAHTNLKYTYTYIHSYSYLRRWGFSASAFLSPHYRIVRRLPSNPHRGYKRLLHNCTTFSQTQNIVAVSCLCCLIWLFFHTKFVTVAYTPRFDVSYVFEFIEVRKRSERQCAYFVLHLPSSFRRFLRNVSFTVYTHCHAHTNPQITNVADRVNICVRTTVYMNMCVKKKNLIDV